MVQTRRSRGSFTARPKSPRLPKEKKAFCSVCWREFLLKELTRAAQGWICVRCLNEIDPR